MNILQVLPGKVWGGAEQYILDLGTELMNRGHKVTFVARHAPAITDRLSGTVGYTEIPIDGFFDFRSGKLLAGLLTDIDVVHLHDIAHAPHIVRACRIAKRKPKIVITRHIARKSKVMPWLRNSLAQVDEIIFVSHLAYNLWTSANEWFPKDKCRIIHNSIPASVADEKDCTDSQLKKMYGINDTVPILMFVGRVRKSKGCGLIIDALAKNKDISWAMLFVGKCKPCNYSNKLIKKAKEYGIGERVFFHGFTNNARALIKESSIGIAPSIVREACALTPMEFMDAGKCVIVSDNGSQKEYIKDGVTGIIVQSNDINSLAAAIRNALTHNEFRNSIEREAKRFFTSEMSYTAFVDRIVSVYEKHI